MSPSILQLWNPSTGQETPGMGPEDVVLCPLPDRPLEFDALTSDLCNGLEEAGCPLVPAVQARLLFEALLVELSATFVNVPANQVDSQIESALQRLVLFLGVDRGGLAELLVAQKQLVITHTY